MAQPNTQAVVVAPDNCSSAGLRFLRREQSPFMWAKKDFIRQDALILLKCFVRGRKSGYNWGRILQQRDHI